jgi:arylsulfatase A-like enzyme
MLILMPLAFAAWWGLGYAACALGWAGARPSSGFAGAAPLPGRPTRVLFVTFDALRADHLSAYGYARQTSPNIDRLADHGVVFTRALATSSWTYPSLSSVFTATFPRTHGVFGPDGHVRPEGVMPMMELLHAGFRTGMFAAHEFSSLKLDVGFMDRSYLFQIPAAEMTDRAIEWVKKNDGGPFFLWLHYFEPHCPYNPPDDVPIPPPSNRPVLGDPYGACPRERAMNPAAVPPPCCLPGVTDVDVYLDRYDRYIRYADREFGRLVDFLRAQPWSENLLILVSADHGEAFGDHNLLDHATWIYEPLLRVPLVVHLGRDLPASRRVEEPVSMVDVLPTVCDLALGHAPRGVEGTSLRAALETGKATRRPLLSEIHENADGANASAAVRFGDLKLMRDGAANQPYYYYDLARDPCERERRPVTWKTLVLSPRLIYLRHVLAAALAKPYPPTPNLSPEQREKLKALGYIRD